MTKKTKSNILISAYFCHPKKGSEAGVGWNFPKRMSMHHNVWVLSNSINRKDIEEEMDKNPIPNLNFIFCKIPNEKIFNERIFGEQLIYIIWQFYALRKYIRVSKRIKFDLIHHLTFNQYRTPSFGFFTNTPFIMGPIGGAETINPIFFQDLNFFTKLKEKWRALGLDRYLFKIIANYRKNPKLFIFSSNRNSQSLNKFVGHYGKSCVVPAIAIDPSDFYEVSKQIFPAKNKLFIIVYAGTAKDWKGIQFLLRSIRQAFINQENILIKLIGIRSEDEFRKVSKVINKYGLSKMVDLINFMPREKLIKEIRSANLSVYAAFRDSGSMSVLEGCALNCPVLCFDAGGQDAFPDNILLKIPVSNSSYQVNVNNFSEKLLWSYNNPQELYKIGKEAREFVLKNLTWDKKVEIFCNLYSDILKLR